MTAKNNIQDIYSLTPMQQGMLFHALLHGTTATYFKQKSYRLRASLDVAVVQKSVQELSRRHDVLRAAFIYENQPRPLQVILREREIGFTYVDLSGEDASRLPEAITDFKRADREMGFDLVKGPLMRVSLLKTDISEYEFIWSHHHILMDGWCTNIIIGEFYEIYDAFLHNRPYVLDTPVPFGRYISWLQEQDSVRSGQYWNEYLQGFDSPASLPRRYHGSGSGTMYEREEIKCALDQETTQRLTAVAAASRLTVYTVCQAIWAVLLSKYSRCNDVVFGSVVSGRPAGIPGIEKMIGLFINTVPVRIQYSPNERFSDLLSRVQERSFESESHHYFSLADIQAASSMKQELVDHIMVFENFPTTDSQGEDKLAEIAVQIGEEEVFEQTNYDLNVIIHPGDALKIVLQFNRLVYDPEEIRQAGSSFISIVQQIVDNPDCSISDLTLTAKKEHNKPPATTAVYILDDQNNILPPGIVGKIAIGETDAAGTYGLTGDWGKSLQDGSVVYLGPGGSEVKIKGRYVYPEEIRQLVTTYPGIGEAEVYAMTINGEMQIVAYYVAGNELNREHLLQYLTQSLPAHMVPASLLQIEEFPRTPDGKTDREKLPDPSYLSEKKSGAEKIPANRAEARLKELWQEVTGRKDIPVDGNLFELGAHSLDAVRVISRIRREFDISFSVKKIFDNPTIRKQVDEMQRANREKWEELTPTGILPAYELSPAQKRMWMLDQIQKDQTAFIIYGVYFIRGKLDTAAFIKSVHALVERHEILRTIFVKSGAGVQQVIQPFDPASCDAVYNDLTADPGKTTEVIAILNGHHRTAFDIGERPPFSVRLLQINPDEFIYTIAVHHIIADGWSVEIIKNELLQLYNAFSNRYRNPLPPLHTQYKDYAAWLQRKLSGDSLQQMRAYWLKVFDGERLQLNMPTDFPRPAIRTFQGNTSAFSINGELTAALRRVAQEKSASLFVSLLGCVVVLLYKYSGQRDITIGTDVAGRVNEDFENQVGLYLNTLALRTTFESTDSFTDLLDNIKENFWDAQQYQLYPIDDLVADLKIPANAGRLPLFDTFLLLQNINRNGVDDTIAGDIRVEEYTLPGGPAKFDLTFIFKETEETLQLLMEYNTDLFLPETIDRLFNDLLLIMNALTTNGAQTVASIQMSRSEEEIAFENLINAGL
ncbi:condensation domain-containing protein [Chitinophaga sp. RAB17]|uniref:condensation domain-containing protein n=1 Tax=Chitinophaga sp. RAB17 TaxID=3233049 RepID=UPI003F8E57C9